MSNHDYTADIRVAKGDKERATALPDANQSTVLPAYAVGTTSPNSRPGRTEVIGRGGDTGVIPVGETKFSVGPQKVNASSEYLSDRSRNGDKTNSL